MSSISLFNPGTIYGDNSGNPFDGVSGFNASSEGAALLGLAAQKAQSIGVAGAAKSFTLDPNMDTSVTGLGTGSAGGTFTQGQNVMQPTDATGNAKQGVTGGFSLTANIAAFIVGVVCVGAGLLMFKSTGTIIVGAGKLAAKGAALAA